MLSESTTSTPERGARGWPFAVTSGILGWVLDAFDFFLVTFLIGELMARYGVERKAIVFTLSMTLAMRPVGALLFGALADRIGRRIPLIVCVLYFTACSVASGLAPTYSVFLICRCLYGIGMGGYWGIGASYAMESAPRKRRGVLSGLMQAGYPFGYLCAALAMQIIPGRFAWHYVFFAGVPVAVAIVVLVLFSPESAAWKDTEKPTLRRMAGLMWQHRGTFFYLLLVMTGMTCLSHGTQDLYPNFLGTLKWTGGLLVLGMKAPLGIAVIYNIGAILGALAIGQLSERIGRRYAILTALGISLVSMHWWAFGMTEFAIIAGAFAMQAGVQGAFGVIPAHLNELSPADVRGLFPGFVYQLGVLLSASAPSVEDKMRDHLGYSWALSGFELCTIAALILLFAFGPEKHGKDFATE